MYQVHRANGQVTISDWNGKVMYLTFDNSIVLYKHTSGAILSERVSKMQDDVLLIALATAVKLPL